MRERRASLQHITLLASFNVSIAVTSFVVHNRAQPLGVGALKKDQDRKTIGIARITPITGRKLTPIATIKKVNSRKATPQAISKSLSLRQSLLVIFQNPPLLNVVDSYFLSS